MTFYDEQLRQLQEQMARKGQLEAKVAELRCQHRELSDRVYDLEVIKLDEQADVDQLEGRSLAAFFYHMTGKMDDRLDKERQEAYAARVKYDAAARELAAVEEELSRHQSALDGLHNCEQRYQALLREKAAAVKNAGGAQAEEILKLEEELAAQNQWEEKVGGHSEGRVGAAPGETLGQRVVGGASMCQVVGSQEKDEGERPVRCQRHQ